MSDVEAKGNTPSFIFSRLQNFKYWGREMMDDFNIFGFRNYHVIALKFWKKINKLEKCLVFFFVVLFLMQREIYHHSSQNYYKTSNIGDVIWGKGFCLFARPGLVVQ